MVVVEVEGSIYREGCEGLPGVYSTIWCLCYKTNKLKKEGKKGAIGRVK
jgi:hypothetical protein